VSAHEHAIQVPVPEIRLGAGAARVERISGIIGVIGLALCVLGFLTNRTVFFQS
jgi:hypothetical protein